MSESAEDMLLSRDTDGVRWLRLNRPQLRNAISPELREALIERLEEAARNESVRCVVLIGIGKAFCSGVDIGRFTVGAPTRDGASPDPASVRNAMKQGMQRLIRTIWELEKPVVAAVNGVAAGGGAQLALACDLVLASESARFIEIFARRGMTVDSGGAYLLPRLIGLARAKELVFFAEPLSAADAERWGLVNRVVPDDDLEAAAGEWAARLAEGPTRAIGASKRLLNRSAESDLTQAFEDEAAAQGENALTEDYREGIAAFAEKRDPQFRGR